jgi:hypothetical protein
MLFLGKKPNKQKEGIFEFFKDIIHLPVERAKPAANFYVIGYFSTLFRQLWS